MINLTEPPAYLAEADALVDELATYAARDLAAVDPTPVPPPCWGCADGGACLCETEGEAAAPPVC